MSQGVGPSGPTLFEMQSGALAPEIRYGRSAPHTSILPPSSCKRAALKYWCQQTCASVRAGAIGQEVPMQYLNTNVRAAAALLCALIFSLAGAAPRAAAADDPAVLA